MLKFMRYIKVTFLCIFILAFLTGCALSKNDISNSKTSLQTQIEETEDKNMNNSQWNINEDNEILISMQIGEEKYTAYLYDNTTSKELLKLMPMTIYMNDMNSNEKFFNLKDNLPTDSRKIGKINSGDIMLYGSNCLVLFYESFSTPYSYSKIGYMENLSGLKDILGDGSVEITLNKID